MDGAEAAAALAAEAIEAGMGWPPGTAWAPVARFAPGSAVCARTPPAGIDCPCSMAAAVCAVKTPGPTCAAPGITPLWAICGAGAVCSWAAAWRSVWARAAIARLGICCADAVCGCAWGGAVDAAIPGDWVGAWPLADQGALADVALPGRPFWPSPLGPPASGWAATGARGPPASQPPCGPWEPGGDAGPWVCGVCGVWETGPEGCCGPWGPPGIGGPEGADGPEGACGPCPKGP